MINLIVGAARVSVMAGRAIAGARAATVARTAGLFSNLTWGGAINGTLNTFTFGIWGAAKKGVGKLLGKNVDEVVEIASKGGLVGPRGETAMITKKVSELTKDEVEDLLQNSASALSSTQLKAVQARATALAAQGSSAAGKTATATATASTADEVGGAVRRSQADPNAAADQAQEQLDNVKEKGFFKRHAGWLVNIPLIGMMFVGGNNEEQNTPNATTPNESPVAVNNTRTNHVAVGSAVDLRGVTSGEDVDSPSAPGNAQNNEIQRNNSTGRSA